VKCRAGPVLPGHSGIGESLTEMGDNGHVQTKVCSQTKGVQSVDVTSAERILGKFFRPTREWPSPGPKTLLVANTGPLVRAIACGVACVR
jgi:hypothetical protein